MLPSDITLDTNVYSLITQRANSSVRSDSSRDLDKPVTLQIAHETSKSGRRSSVIIFSSAETISCNDTCDLVPQTDEIRAQLKVQFNPLSGRADIETELRRLCTEIIRIEADATLWDRFIHGES